MTWRNRPGVDPEQRFDELEKTLGIENIRDFQVDEDALKLYIFTETHKYSVNLTLVS